MISIRLSSLVLIHVGIAINAAVRAGVVGADVGTLGAAALLPRGLFLMLKPIGKKELLNDAAVDAVGFGDSAAYQIIAATGRHPDAVALRDGRQLISQLDFEALTATGDFHACGLFEFREIAFDLTVFGHEAEDAALDETLEFAGQLFKGFEEETAVANAG